MYPDDCIPNKDMNPQSINVLPYAPISNNALIIVALVVIGMCVIAGLILNHRHKMKQAEHEHTQAMADISNEAKK